MTDTRTCSKCGQTKNVEQNFRQTNHTRCKACLYQAHKDWVAKNRKRNAALCKESAALRRPARDALIDKAKSRPCADCGAQFPPKAMDFDHLPGTSKHCKVSRYRRLGYSLKKIQEEIDKCEVVCANCHRLRTFERSNRLRDQDVSPDTARYRHLQDWVNKTFKCGPCSICFGVFQPCQMDFDHIAPTSKLSSVADLLRKRASYARIEAEINKCRLLCANCHRLVTQLS